MALAWSAALSPSQILRQHRTSGTDAQAFVLRQERQARYGFHSPNQKGIKPTQRACVFLCASLGESVEDKDTESRKNEESSQRSSVADATEPQTVNSENPFVGAKISSQIAARARGSSNGTGQASTTASPTSPKISDSPPELPSFDFPVARPQASVNFSSKPAGSRTFSPKPLGSPVSPFNSPSSGTEKLKGAKPSVFVNSRAAGGVFKEPGAKAILDTLRGPEEKNSKFAQPIVPKNLFDEPEKLTAEDKKRFDFTFNAGQLILIFSFLTIIGLMLGTAFLVWKLGAIHYNDY